MARTVKLKEPVRIRFRELADGTKSIYLDIYKNGARRYEFLKLYLYPGKSEAIRRRNAATLAAAESIKSQRVIELTNRQAGIPNTGLRSKMLLADWMQEFYESQIRKGVKGQKLLLTSAKVLKLYAPKARMREVNREFCLGYIDFLRNTYKGRLGKPLTPYGAISYFGFLRTALNAAVRAQVIVENPINRLTQADKIKMPESQRVYLTIDEVKRMIATPCTKDIVRRAFLFACYCGMRLSDVSALQWKDLSKDGGQWRACIVMPRVLKSRDTQAARSRDMAEVFTPSWICNAQNNLIDEAWFGRKDVFNAEYTDEQGYHRWQPNAEKIQFPEGKTWKDYVRDIRLEITCGEAPYIVSRYDTTNGEAIPIKERIGLLDRKLRVVGENTGTSGEWLEWAQEAYKSIYAYEWQGDNLLIARESMLISFIEYYQQKFGKQPLLKSIHYIAYIISWNVW